MTTIKQKLAAKNLVGNGGNVTKAMLDAGYSKATANTPQKLTESKAWPELVEDYLPNDKLLKAPNEALEATKWNDFTGEREADHTTRLKASELGLKIKGRMNDITFNQQFNFGKVKDDERKEFGI